MNRLLEKLNYFVYESEADFFDINKGEAKVFINEIENFEKKFIEFEDKVDKLLSVINEIENIIYKNKEYLSDGFKDSIFDLIDRKGID